jgi:hypothetical protein
MSAPSFSCPYCNAILTAAEAPSSGSRIQCPRCGESFPSPSGLNDQGTSVPRESWDSNGQPNARPVGSGISNRTLALYILAFMGLVALAFLGYAWQTQQIRREHDLQLPKGQSITIPLGIALACDVYIIALVFAILRPQNRPGPMRLTMMLAAISTVIVTTGLLRVHIRVSSDSNPSEDVFVAPVARHARPAELSALGYLPAEVNLIIGVQVSALMETREGQEYLAGAQPDKASNLLSIQNWTGLELKDIDYVVAGLRIDNNLLPGLILVIETKRPFDAAKFHEKLRASRWPDPEAVRFPSSHTLILALNKKELEHVSAIADAGIHHLSASLQAALRERIALGSQVWAVGHAQDWKKTLALTYLATLPEENRKVLEKIQTFAVGVHVEKPTTITGAFQCVDEPSAQALEEFFRRQHVPEFTNVKSSQKETWVSIQANLFDLSSLSSFLSAPNGVVSPREHKKTPR